MDILILSVEVGPAPGTHEERRNAILGKRHAVFRIGPRQALRIGGQPLERGGRSHTPPRRAGIVEAFGRAGSAPQGIGTRTPQPVIPRLLDPQDKGQRIEPGILHRSGCGIRSHRRGSHARIAAVVHRGGRTVGEVVGSRADEGILAAPLVIEPVGGEDLLVRRIGRREGPEVAVHHRIAVERALVCGVRRIVIRHPDVPAPEQRSGGIVGADQGISRLDLRLVVAVRTHVERSLSVLQRQVLDQARSALPDDPHRCRCQRRTVAAMLDIEQVVGLLLVGDVAVGRLRGEVLAADHPDEERGRARGTATARTAQGHRAGFSLPLVERRGRRHPNGLRRGIHRHVIPPGGFAGDREAVEIRGREVDRRRSRLALREEDGGRIEGERTGHIVVAARDEKGGGKNRAPPSESFHIHRVLLNFNSKNRCKDTKKRDNSYNVLSNFAFGNDYCRFFPNEL